MSDLKTRLKLDLERGITPPLEDAGFTYGFNGDYLRQGSVLISHFLIDFGFFTLCFAQGVKFSSIRIEFEIYR